MLTPSMKKRLAIACEMVMNPSVILIDDPLSGLPLYDSLQLMRILKYYVENTNRMLVIAFHACPGNVFRICSKFIFLYKSEVAFSGKADELLRFMRGIDLQCPHGYSTAEYLLELLCEDTLTDDQPIQDRIVSAFRNITKPKEAIKETTLTFTTETCLVADYFDYRVKDTMNPDNTVAYRHGEEEVQVLLDPSSEFPATILPKTNRLRHSKVRSRRYKTPNFHQFLVLLVRNFHNARRRILSPVNIILNIYILLICVLIWWRMERRDDTVKDRMGLFFFTVVLWTFFALSDAILTFPEELKVINKERRHKQYSLSAFCLSKTISEIPLVILQPTVYLCVIYWVANLNGAHAFLSSVGVLVLDVIAAQSIGLLVGASLQPPWTVRVVALGFLSMMLLGGIFNTPPQWLRWGKYASYFSYGMNALKTLEFNEAPPIQCSNNSMVPTCHMIHPMLNQTTSSFDVLDAFQIDWPLWGYLAVLVGIMVVTRLLWYCVMRRKKIR